MIGQDYDYGIDMWALACTLFELYTGRILFQVRFYLGKISYVAYTVGQQRSIILICRYLYQ